MKTIQLWDFGITAGNDVTLTARLGNLLKDLQGEKGLRLQFQAGEYHFYSQNAVRRFLCISNHDDDGEKSIALDFSDFQDLTIDGNGSRFVFHGDLLPFYCKNGTNLRLENFTVDYHRTAYSQGEILEVSPQKMTLQINPKQYPWTIHQGKLCFFCEDIGAQPLGLWLEMDKHTGGPVYDTLDVLFRDDLNWGRAPLSYTATALSQDKVEMVLHGDSRFLSSTQAGNHLILRHHPRSHPCVYITDSKNVACNNVTVHHAFGMGFLSERTENITLEQFHVRPDEKAPRCFSAVADATHFVCCYGEIMLRDCVFQNQLDDGVNIHGIYGKVRSWRDNSMDFSLEHFQQQGVPIARKGDMVDVLACGTMTPLWSGMVTDLYRLEDGGFRISFMQNLPAHLPQTGILLENRTAKPHALITGCTLQNNRARGMLLTCKTARVENCDFTVAGAAILLEGDAATWFESGETEEILLQNNHFHNCAYVSDWGRAPIQSSPTTQKTDYHKRLILRDNHFQLFDRRLLYLRHVEALVCENNHITHTDAYPPMDGDAVVVADCGFTAKEIALEVPAST